MSQEMNINLFALLVGKYHMSSQAFERAHQDFFEAFKAYDEAGNSRRTQCLKYLVLANMLDLSDIDPFDSPEAKPYMNNADIVAMTTLRRAYTGKDVAGFEAILRSNGSTIMDDSFIREHIEELLRKFRSQVLIKLIKPYTRIGIPHAAKALNIEEKEVENLLVTLILDEKINGRIDQVNRILILGDPSEDKEKYEAIDRWSSEVARLQASITGKLL
jgi:COP9 signalosome complex subunit 2